MTSARRAAEMVLREAVAASDLPLRIERSGAHISIVHGKGDATIALDFHEQSLNENADPEKTVRDSVSLLEKAVLGS